jgi:hypothetical protein
MWTSNPGCKTADKAQWCVCRDPSCEIQLRECENPIARGRGCRKDLRPPASSSVPFESSVNTSPLLPTDAAVWNRWAMCIYTSTGASVNIKISFDLWLISDCICTCTYQMVHTVLLRIFFVNCILKNTVCRSHVRLYVPIYRLQSWQTSVGCCKTLWRLIFQQTTDSLQPAS